VLRERPWLPPQAHPVWVSYALLRGLGTAIDDPRRDLKLKELERRAVGEGMTARTGQRFLDKVPEGFRGYVKAGPEGAPYVVVTDGSRFVLLPASRELRALNEKVVSVSRDDPGAPTRRCTRERSGSVTLRFAARVGAIRAALATADARA
jgi:hypothetical protein